MTYDTVATHSTYTVVNFQHHRANVSGDFGGMMCSACCLYVK